MEFKQIRAMPYTSIEKKGKKHSLKGTTLQTDPWGYGNQPAKPFYWKGGGSSSKLFRFLDADGYEICSYKLMGDYSLEMIAILKEKGFLK